jgi:LysM repeat protein
MPIASRRTSLRLLLPALVAPALALAGTPGSARAQGDAADTVHLAQPPRGGVPAIQEEWATPFAVQSVGRPSGRAPRRVVVLAEPAAAPAPVTVPAPVTAPAPARTETAAATPPPRAATPRTPPAPPAARPATRAVAAARTHKVEWGETWYGIARENGISARELSAANPDVDPEHLRSGEVIRIPRSASSAAGRSHRVVAGETLWGISRRYGVAAAAIRRANHMTDDKVRIGQLLVIPQEENR